MPFANRCAKVRSVIGATTIDPKLLTAAERIQYEGCLRREETNASILELSKSRMAIKQIVRQTGHSRKLVRQVARGKRTDVFRTRQSSLDVHLPWLDEQWASDCRNGAELWRRLPWSNGQTEGQITRLKPVRRQMYGRGNIDLLQARLIGSE
jgi:transposase